MFQFVSFKKSFVSLSALNFACAVGWFSSLAFRNALVTLVGFTTDRTGGASHVFEFLSLAFFAPISSASDIINRTEKYFVVEIPSQDESIKAHSDQMINFAICRKNKKIPRRRKSFLLLKDCDSFRMAKYHRIISVAASLLFISFSCVIKSFSNCEFSACLRVAKSKPRFSLTRGEIWLLCTIETLHRSHKRACPGQAGE